MLVGAKALLLLALAVTAEAKRASAPDCADCQVRKPAVVDSFSSEHLETVVNRVNARKSAEIPAQLPAKRQVAAVYGGHKNEQMKPGYPWNAVGRLLMAGGDMCTGTRISACHVFSNAHCARFKSGKLRTVLSFQPPFEEKAYAMERDASGQGKLLAGESADFNEDSSHDWAILKLEDSSSGLRDGWLGVRDSRGSELVGQTLQLAGIRRDLSPNFRYLYIDDKVEIIRNDEKGPSKNPNQVFFRANTSHGTSGAPIFRLDAEGKAWIVGLNAKGFVEGENIFLPSDETNLLASGVATNAFFTQIQKFMTENPCNP